MLNDKNYQVLDISDASLDVNLPFVSSSLRFVFDAGSVGSRDYYYKVLYIGADGEQKKSYVHISSCFFKHRNFEWRPKLNKVMMDIFVVILIVFVIYVFWNLEANDKGKSMAKVRKRVLQYVNDENWKIRSEDNARRDADLPFNANSLSISSNVTRTLYLKYTLENSEGKTRVIWANAEFFYSLPLSIVLKEPGKR